MDIFEHEDSDGDGFYLRPRGNTLKFRPWGTDHSILAREDVARLRDALTEWLGDGETESTPAPVDPEMVRSIAREIVQDELRRIQVQGTTPIKARFLTEEEMHSNVLRGETVENIWGRPCATCGHSTGVHSPIDGCMHPDGCECAWPDTSAAAPECTCPAPHRIHDPVVGCVDCLCKWTGSASAPEPASAPECVCPHRIRMHGPEAGCVECKCTWTGSAP